MGKLVYRKWLATARSQASRTAIFQVDGRLLTFLDLMEGVEQRLEQFKDTAYWRHRAIAFQFENSAEWLITFLTCQALEAIALPLDPDIPRDGITRILKTLRPAALWDKESIEPLNHSIKRAPACLIKLTSGSSGLPKPLFFEDRHILADGKQIADTMNIGKGDTNLALIPFGHSYGLGNLIMPLIQLGVPMAICRDPFPYTIAHTIKQTGATIVPTVPAILKALAHSEISPQELKGVRLWISAGSPLSPNDAQNFHTKFRNHIHNFYGSSETGGIAFDRTGHDTLSGRAVGTPLKDVRVSLSQSNRLRICSRSVFIRGNRLKAGNFGSHLLTDEVDLLKDNSIVIHGRRGRVVKIGGKRVNLQEIERHLINLEGVDEARVVDYVNQAGTTRLAVAIAPIQNSSLAKEALKAHLPKWKIPDRWLTIESFPVNKRGKIHYSEIESHLQNRITRRGKS